jgi:GNAT superfamily N-acetyltransferase
MLVYENKTMNLSAYSLDITHWEDFEELLGERGGCGGCWCMSWRLKMAEFEKQKGELNKLNMKYLVENNEDIGVIVYIDGNPIGWCASAPREKFVRLENSRILKRIDNEPVWSITCLFLSKAYRRKGISVEVIKAVINYCKLKGANIIEAYPVIPYENKIPDAFLWTGIPSSFEKAGFVIVEKRSKWKWMMRYYI